MAVALPSGLVVPVLRNADQLTISEIAVKAKDLAGRARQGKLTGDEMSGGTFTVSNLGMFGVDTFTPILNAPEVGILGVGRIVEKPAVVGGTIQIRSLMSLSLSFDHRALDGAQAAHFLRRSASCAKITGSCCSRNALLGENRYWNLRRE